MYSNQSDYDSAEPLETGDTSKLVAHIYEMPDLHEYVSAFIYEHPEHALFAIDGDIKAAFEEWYYWNNKDEVLRLNNV